MDSDSSQQENIEGDSSNLVYDARTFFQSFWVRYCTVLVNVTNWKFMESQFRFVLCSGCILWIIYVLSILT